MHQPTSAHLPPQATEHFAPKQPQPCLVPQHPDPSTEPPPTIMASRPLTCSPQSTWQQQDHQPSSSPTSASLLPLQPMPRFISQPLAVSIYLALCLICSYTTPTHHSQLPYVPTKHSLPTLPSAPTPNHCHTSGTTNHLCHQHQHLPQICHHSHSPFMPRQPQPCLAHPLPALWNLFPTTATPQLPPS